MCGISGWIHWNQNICNEKETLHAMNQKLTPRGPDQEGIWTSSHAGLAHRRLSVIDLENGKQPMVHTFDDQKFVIVFNGEIYNFQEIRRKLAFHGVSFKGTGDTEVLLHSYIIWGKDCLAHLNGIFAFAIWDENQELFVARDRVGVKPFFFACTDEQFIFASEIKALLVHPYIRPSVDATGIMELLMIGPGRTPGITPFSSIKELLPGYFGLFTRSGWKTFQYWQPNPLTLPDSTEDLSQLLYDLLDQIVEEQQVSDVPLGFFLSGGLDSSALTALAAKKRPGIFTFSIDYLEQKHHFHSSDWTPDQDEWYARAMATFLGTKHRTIEIHPNDLCDALPYAREARDLPGMSDIDASLYLFCRQVKNDVTVAISGEGADELFGGYPWFLKVSQFDPHDSTAWPGRFPPWMNEQSLRADLIQPRWTNQISPMEYSNKAWLDAYKNLPKHNDDDPLESKMRDLMFLNVSRFMPVLLDRKDRMSMASGLEVRVPFCDHRIVEFAWNLPWKYKRLFDREKGLLRHAMQNQLPNEILNRKKSPFPRIQHPQFYRFIFNEMKQLTQSSNEPIFQIIDPVQLKLAVDFYEKNDHIRWFGQLFGNVQWCGYLLQLNAWLKSERIQLIT